MNQLSAVDTNFLHLENGRTVAHIGGLGIVDPTLCPGGRLTREAVVELVRQRAHLTGPLRRKLAAAPFGIDRPYWIDDAGFDPAWHVHEVGLPTPGSDLQLAEEIARLHERPLDRRRPLWELYLVQGLAGGRAALYLKVHHAAIDGVLAAELLTVLLDVGPEPPPMPAPDVREPERPPSTAEMVGAGLAGAALHPFRAARSIARTAQYLDQVPGIGQYPGAGLVTRAARTVLRRGARGVPGMPRLTAPRTPFDGPIGARRGFAFGSLPLADVQRVRRSLDVSVNDVVIAMSTTALRRWLLKRDALPDRPLVAAVPVSLRKGGQGCDGANRLSAMIAPLPTHIDDAGERFEAVRRSMRTVKRRFVAASAGGWFEELSGIVPAAFSGAATRAAMRLAPVLMQPVNVMISNVRGPQLPLYMSGARVLDYHPASVVSDLTGGVNITVFSYAGNLDIGIVACPDLVPDVWEPIDYLRDALEELKILADT
ncbi:MAG: WS/DGAT/MGAT family O-acyltransferase [Actinomadura sp.]